MKTASPKCQSGMNKGTLPYIELSDPIYIYIYLYSTLYNLRRSYKLCNKQTSLFTYRKHKHLCIYKIIELLDVFRQNKLKYLISFYLFLDSRKSLTLSHCRWTVFPQGCCSVSEPRVTCYDNQRIGDQRSRGCSLQSGDLIWSTKQTELNTSVPPSVDYLQKLTIDRMFNLRQQFADYIL